MGFVEPDPNLNLHKHCKIQHVCLFLVGLGSWIMAGVYERVQFVAVQNEIQDLVDINMFFLYIGLGLIELGLSRGMHSTAILVVYVSHTVFRETGHHVTHSLFA